MKYGIIPGTPPKRDGLCHAMTEAVFQGAKAGGAEPEILNVEQLDRCHAWGICREKHCCAFGADGFDLAREALRAADQLCFITPVYWGEMAEALKGFFDRLRRCDFGPQGVLGGKGEQRVAHIRISPGNCGVCLGKTGSKDGDKAAETDKTAGGKL